MKLSIRVYNWVLGLVLSIWYFAAPDSSPTYFHNLDGRLVPMDDWDGYDNCMRPGCGHYRCEHSFGEEHTVVYVAPRLLGVEGQPQPGESFAYPIGCMNAGCNCAGFWTESDLLGFVQQLNYARINGAWDLEQVPGVRRVESDVDISVRFETFMTAPDAQLRENVYDAERGLYDKHPGVLLDFHVRWDESPDEE